MSEFMLQIEKLFQAISDPEYRFILMEPLIFYGIIFGLIIFIASFFMRVVKFQTVALILIILAAMAHIPYTAARQQAEPRMEQVYKISSPSRVKMFKANSVEWKQGAWVFLALAAVAAATVLVGSQRNRLGLLLTVATVIFGLLAIKNSLWLHYQDSLAYHPNLKSHDSPLDKKKKTSTVKTPPKSTPAPKSKPIASLLPLSTRNVTPVAPPKPPPVSTLTRPAQRPVNSVATAPPPLSTHQYTIPMSTRQAVQRPQPQPISTTRIPRPTPPALNTRPAPRPATRPLAAPRLQFQKPIPATPPVQYQPPLPVR